MNLYPAPRWWPAALVCAALVAVLAVSCIPAPAASPKAAPAAKGGK